MSFEGNKKITAEVRGKRSPFLMFKFKDYFMGENTSPLKTGMMILPFIENEITEYVTESHLSIYIILYKKARLHDIHVSELFVQ